MIKNVKNSMLKKTIFMEFDDFADAVLKATDGFKYAEYSIDGLNYYDTKKAEESDIYYNKDIEYALSEYFGVDVKSINQDTCEYPGIWIVYEDKVREKEQGENKKEGKYVYDMWIPVTGRLEAHIVSDEQLTKEEVRDRAFEEADFGDLENPDTNDFEFDNVYCEGDYAEEEEAER